MGEVEISHMFLVRRQQADAKLIGDCRAGNEVKQTADVGILLPVVIAEEAFVVAAQTRETVACRELPHFFKALIHSELICPIAPDRIRETIGNAVRSHTAPGVAGACRRVGTDRVLKDVQPRTRVADHINLSWWIVGVGLLDRDAGHVFKHPLHVAAYEPDAQPNVVIGDRLLGAKDQFALILCFGSGRNLGQLTGVEVANLPNPRREAAENELNVSRDRFLALGLNPTTLSEGLLEEVQQIAVKYRDRADTSKIIARSVWRSGMETAPDLVK